MIHTNIAILLLLAVAIWAIVDIVKQIRENMKPQSIYTDEPLYCDKRIKRR